MDYKQRWWWWWKHFSAFSLRTGACQSIKISRPNCNIMSYNFNVIHACSPFVSIYLWWGPCRCPTDSSARPPRRSVLAARSCRPGERRRRAAYSCVSVARNSSDDNELHGRRWSWTNWPTVRRPAINEQSKWTNGKDTTMLNYDDLHQINEMMKHIIICVVILGSGIDPKG